jgi:transposase
METKIEEKGEKRFKKYDQNEAVLLPIQLERMIPIGSLARIVNDLVDRIGVEELLPLYKTKGCPPYHPLMLIKVWIYGYCEGVYTSRRLAKSLREGIVYMWLSGNQQPCFKTLSEFRGSKMQHLVDSVFTHVLSMLVELGYIDLDELYVDGTKIEANANKYSGVWAKNTARYKAKVQERIGVLLEELKAMQKAEDEKYGSKDLAEVGQGQDVSEILTSDQIQSSLQCYYQAIEDAKTQDKAQQQIKELAKGLKKVEKELTSLERYEQQERILAGRNSYSKTDPDATMMRLKDERLAAAYNLQHSTSNQYIVNYTVAQNTVDNTTLISHLNKMDQRWEDLQGHGVQIQERTAQDPAKTPSFCGDAGYGSEENYAELERRGWTAYVKYPLWHQEISGELSKKKFRRENWPFDEKADYYLCPNDRKLTFLKLGTNTTKTGYVVHVRIYQCEDCQGCPFALECKGNSALRTVQHSPKGEQYKKQAKALLDSDEGQQARSQRSVEVESAFGNIKYNMGYDRFLLRELPKVYVEYGFWALAHNLRKVYCEQSGVWKQYYAQRASKKGQKVQKRA